MDLPTFQSLSYGDILQDETGRTVVVLHTNRDAKGNTTAIGVLECQASAPANWKLVRQDPQATAVIHPETGVITGMLKPMALGGS